MIVTGIMLEPFTESELKEAEIFVAWADDDAGNSNLATDLKIFKEAFGKRGEVPFLAFLQQRNLDFVSEDTPEVHSDAENRGVESDDSQNLSNSDDSSSLEKSGNVGSNGGSNSNTEVGTPSRISESE